jgi:hypothetical protein
VVLRLRLSSKSNGHHKPPRRSKACWRGSRSFFGRGTLTARTTLRKRRIGHSQLFGCSVERNSWPHRRAGKASLGDAREKRDIVTTPAAPKELAPTIVISHLRPRMPTNLCHRIADNHGALTPRSAGQRRDRLISFATMASSRPNAWRERRAQSIHPRLATANLPSSARSTDILHRTN